MDPEARGPYYTALQIIVGSISRKCLHLVQNREQDPATLWEVLQQYYNPLSRMNRYNLKASFFHITLIEAGGKISKYIEEINLQAQRINEITKALNKKSSSSSSKSAPLQEITDDDKLCVLMAGLQNQFKMIRTVIDASDDMTFEKACKLLVDHELSAHLVEESANWTDHADYVRERSGKRLREPSRWDSQSQSSSSTSSSDPNNMMKRQRPWCKVCRRTGHTETTCWDAHPELKANFLEQEYAEEKSFLADQEEEDHMCLIAREAESRDLEFRPLDGAHYLVIDSGCSIHLVGKAFLPFLTNFRQSTMRSVKLADGKMYQTDRMCALKVKVSTSEGVKYLSFKDVLYIPEINEGLISVSSVCRVGGKVTFDDDGAQVSMGKFSYKFPRTTGEKLYKVPISPKLRIKVKNISRITRNT